MKLPLAGRIAGLVLTGLAAGAVLTGCGGGSAAATTPSADASGSASGGATGIQAYLSCLNQHGVTLPSRAPGARATRSPGARPSFSRGPRPSGSAGAGRFGGGFGGFGRLRWRPVQRSQQPAGRGVRFDLVGRVDRVQVIAAHRGRPWQRRLQQQPVHRVRQLSALTRRDVLGRPERTVHERLEGRRGAQNMRTAATDRRRTTVRRTDAGTERHRLINTLPGRRWGAARSTLTHRAAPQRSVLTPILVRMRCPNTVAAP